MSIKITQVLVRPTDRYPWTHRVEISDDIVEDVYHWELGCARVPGGWVGSNSFYTDSKGATLFALRWT